MAILEAVGSARVASRIVAGLVLLPVGVLLVTLLRSPAHAQPVAHAHAAAVDWRADAERSWRHEWASSSCETNRRIRRVRSPRAQGRYAYRIEVRDGDNSFGERCELGEGNPTRSGFPLFHEGDERWISWQVYLPRHYPVHTDDWNVFMQLKQLGALGTPVVSMEVREGRFLLLNSDSNHDSSDTVTKWSGVARRHRWVRFSLHVTFSPRADVGFLELFGDLRDGRGERRLSPLIHTYTMKVSSGRTVPSHARIGIYRDPAIRGTARIFFDGYSIADSRASAERSAFARAR